MDEVLSIVEVDFLVPTIGKVTEKYNLMKAGDVAAWKANNRFTAAIQLRVREVGFVRMTEDNLERLRQARSDAEIICKELKAKPEKVDRSESKCKHIKKMYKKYGL